MKRRRDKAHILSSHPGGGTVRREPGVDNNKIQTHQGKKVFVNPSNARQRDGIEKKTMKKGKGGKSSLPHKGKQH